MERARDSRTVGVYYYISGTHNSYTVGWVCALSKEQTAATAMLDQIYPDLSKPPNDHNTYTLGSIREHNIVIACLPKGKYGTTSAAAAATLMVSTFPSIKVGLMVGIGGGIPPKVRLGDVVVSTPVGQYPGVVQWDMGKAEKDDNFERTGALNNPPNALLTALTKLETKQDMHGSKISQHLDDMGKKWPNLVQNYTRSDSLQDPFSTPDDFQHAQGIWQIIFSLLCVKTLFLLGYLLGQQVLAPLNSGAEQVRSRAVNQKKPGGISVHYGLIASGNQVIKDAKFRDNLNKSLGGNVLCFEMEAAGLMDHFPCIVIRGICDYADSQKNKDWQEHAAAVAAAFAKELLEYVQPTDVDGERPVKDILGQVFGTVSKIEADVEIVKSNLDRKKGLEVLNWLTDTDYGSQQSDFVKRREQGTCQWLLDSVEYQDWLKSDQQALFCPGIPGSGKTIVTSVVIHDLTKRFSKVPGVGIAYIYFNFRRKDEQNVDKLLLSLLKQLTEQLAERQSPIPESVKRLYDHHKTKRTRPSLDEAIGVLQSVVAVYSRIFFMLDALDEFQASEARATFLSELFNIQTLHKTNIFATSRFIPDIIDQFKPSISLEIVASTDDVARYLRGHIGLLRSVVQQNRNVQEEIVIGISEAVDGMFLLAQIYLGLLDDKLTLNDIRGALEVYQKQDREQGEDGKDRILAHAYEQSMERILGQKAGLKQLAMKVLSWITSAKRPLTTSELQHALAVKAGKFELDQGDLPHIGDMVSVCSGLVTIDEESDIIRLVHYTTQKYFERTQQDWFPDVEIDITETCVTYLMFHVFKSGFCQTWHEFEERLQTNQFYDYAARNWGYHASTGSTRVEELIVNLLQNEDQMASSGQAMMHTRYFSTEPTRMTGVHVAAYFGLRNAMATLLQNEDKSDLEDKYGRTSLSWAAKNGYEAVVKLILEKNGVDINSNNINYGTLLSLAAENGHEAVVKLLLEKDGVDINSKDSIGRTALLLAAENGHEAVVKLLLEKDGVDIN